MSKNPLSTLVIRYNLGPPVSRVRVALGVLDKQATGNENKACPNIKNNSKTIAK